MSITRRKFIKSSGLAAALLPISDLAHAVDHVPSSPKGVNSSVDQRIHSICGMCQAGCYIDGIVNDGKLVRIEGNPIDPDTEGKICARGKAAAKMLYDPDRLKHPLKRVGERGEGKWRRISWDEAIDTIFNQLENTIKKYGTQSLSLFHNGPSSYYISELFAEIGCQHFSNPAWEFCRANRDLAYGLTVGASFNSPDFKAADCIVLIGSHLGENIQVPVLRNFSKALSNNTSLIVVDPRFSTAASKADYHLMIRPGTDTALMLGWIKHIIDSRLYNYDHANQLNGFEELRQHVKQISLNDISQITDISVRDIKKTAETMAAASPSTTIAPGMHSSWYGNDVQRLRTKAILSVLLGAVDTKAKSINIKSLFPDHNRLSSTIFKKAISGDIRYVGIWGQNPFQAYPNPYRTKTALQNVDFVFCTDIYPGDACMFADIILPEASFLERSDVLEYRRTGEKTCVAARQPIIKPRFECRDPFWIVKQLSSRLGKGDFDYADVSERLEKELKKTGVSWFEMREKGCVQTSGFDVDDMDVSSLVKTKPSLYSDELLESGQLPLPVFEAVNLPPAGYARLLYGRSPVHSLSSTTNNKWLNHEVPENILWLNDKVASKLKISNGNRLFIENQDGIRSLKPLKIKVTPGIRVDCVYMVHGFGGISPFLDDAFNSGVSVASMLNRSTPDPISSVRGMRCNHVRFVDANGQPLSIPQLDNPPSALRDSSKWWLDSFGSYETGCRRKKYV